MRTATVCLILVAGVVAGFMLSIARTTPTLAAPTLAAPTLASPAPTSPTPADAPASLVGRLIQVNFRKADDISFPATEDGKMHLAMKLTSIKGTVLSAPPGWLELKTDPAGAFTHVWIPIPSIAFINDVQEPKAPTTQP